MTKHIQSAKQTWKTLWHAFHFSWQAFYYVHQFSIAFEIFAICWNSFGTQSIIALLSFSMPNTNNGQYKLYYCYCFYYPPVLDGWMAWLAWLAQCILVTEILCTNCSLHSQSFIHFSFSFTLMQQNGIAHRLSVWFERLPSLKQTLASFTQHHCVLSYYLVYCHHKHTYTHTEEIAIDTNTNTIHFMHT